MQEELSKNKERLEIANKKSLELDNNSNEVKDIVNNLKTTFTNKDKYVLNKDDKDKIDKLKSSKLNKDNYILSKSDKYIDVINDMYEDNVLDDDIKDLKLNKEKDDFER